MSDLISRSALKKEFNLYFGGVSHAVIAARIIDDAPAADVAPVVHGEWETHTFKKEGMTVLLCICSNCDCRNGAETNFCPNCGADMRERKESK